MYVIIWVFRTMNKMIPCWAKLALSFLCKNKQKRKHIVYFSDSLTTCMQIICVSTGDVVRPSVATITIVSSSLGRGLLCKVGVEVTCQADPRLEESRTVWARDGGSRRRLGVIFPCLPALLCCISSAGFSSLGVLVDCGSSPPSVLCFSFPRVMVDGKCLEG